MRDSKDSHCTLVAVASPSVGPRSAAAAAAQLAAERNSQRLVRYEALLTLLDDLRSQDTLQAVVDLVTPRWKYLASISAWRLAVPNGTVYVILEGSRNQCTVQAAAGLPPWDQHHWDEGKTALCDPAAAPGTDPPSGAMSDPNVQQLMVLPLLQKNLTVGVLTVATKEDGFDEMDQKFVRMFGAQLTDHVALLLMRQRELDRLRSLVTRDALTGALNRAGIMDMLSSQLALSRRTGQPLSVVIADADHFKRVNDVHGHPAGDEVLRELSRRFSTLTRLGEHFGRYGGEEFVFVLFPCSGDQAVLAADRVRRGIAERPFVIDHASGRELPVTISMGAASTSQLLMPSPEELIKHADEALYAAKAAGRNAVRLAHIEAAEPTEMLAVLDAAPVVAAAA